MIAFSRSPWNWRQYVWNPSGGYEPSFGVRHGPGWQDYVIDNPSGEVAARSMLTMYELAVLFHIAKDHYTGEGEIFDGGPLLGVGTNAMCRGLLSNNLVEDSVKRVHSFDLFEARDMGYTVEYLADYTGSVFEEFARVTRDFGTTVSVNPGDLMNFRWPNRPIEFMFIDVAKTWSLNNHLVSNFFNHLIPGRSLVVQQDWVYFDQYWIHLTMEYLEEHFELVDIVNGASAVFRCISPIPPMRGSEVQSLPVSAQLDLFDRCIEKMPASAAEVIKCAKARCLLDNGLTREARRTVDSVRTDISDPDPAREFSQIAESNKAAMNSLLDSTPP